MGESKKTVLVTAIGTAAATAIVSELRRMGGFFIIGTDIFARREVATSKDVDLFLTVPSAIDDESYYLSYILELCETHNVDYYFAVIDEEVANISANKKRFSAIGVKLCVADNQAVTVCHEKTRFCSWIERNYPRIAIKRYESFAEMCDSAFPVFVKPKFGRASNGCMEIRTREELISRVGDESEAGGLIVQEYVSGDIVTVDVFRNGTTGESDAIPRLERLRNGNGCGIAVSLFYDQELIHLCKSIAKDLNIDGVVNMEFFKLSAGYKIIEINPRFSAGAIFSCMAGADLVGNAIRIANGDGCVINPVRFEAHFAKRYEAYEMS